MKTIHYAGDAILTSDALADAVVEYAASLARVEGSAELTIPVLLEDGSQSTASMLLGPASQLISTAAPSVKDSIDDADLVAEIVAATLALGPIKAEPVDSAPVGGIDELGLE